MRYPYILMGCNTLVAVASSAFQTYVHMVSSKLSKAKLVAKENDVEIQIPRRLNSLINTVMDDMKLEKKFKDSIKPYLCNGIDTVHYGNVMLCETHVGFPQNFTVDEKMNINLTTMVDDLNLSADSPECQKLKSSLVLSDKAKKFAIAESFYEVIHLGLPVKLLLPIVCAGLGNAVIFIFALKKYGPAMNHFYSHIAVITLLFYFVLCDLINVYTQLNSDFQAAKLGKAYLEGGVEYYEKVLERNKTIKKLNEKAPFTVEGESNKFSFQAKLSYYNRLQFLSKFEESKNVSFYKSLITAMLTV